MTLSAAMAFGVGCGIAAFAGLAIGVLLAVTVYTRRLVEGVRDERDSIVSYLRYIDRMEPADAPSIRWIADSIERHAHHAPRTEPVR